MNSRNNRSILETANDKIASLQHDLDRERARNASLSSELTVFRKLAKADDILKTAYHSPQTSPANLVSKTIEDFLDKRAYLMTQGGLELNKTAELLSYANGNEIRFGLVGDDTDDSDRDGGENLYRHIDNYRAQRGR